MAKVDNKIETCKDFAENFQKKFSQGMKRNKFLANSSQFLANSSQFLRDGFGIRSGWVAIRKSPEAEAPGQVSKKIS